MAFANANNFRIDRSTFNDAQRDINYFNVHGGDLDIGSCVHSIMKDHIYTNAYHNSGARRAPSRCYPGTREVALRTISDWLRDPASHCLWLHGPAGTGKSAIAHTFAEQCHQNRTLGASYFFTRGSISGSPPLFPTLAYQLLSAVPDLDTHLWEVIREDRTVLQRSMAEQLDKLIVRPFLKLVERPAHIVIVIDGLDECDDITVQGEIVQLILGVRAHSLPLRFLITSRPELDIRRSFKSSPYSPPTYLPLNASLDPDSDIRHFLCKELGRIYKECVEDGMRIAPRTTWPSPEAIDQLVRKSSGHFIYASTVIKFVQEGRANPVERLNAMLQISNKPTKRSAFVHSAAFQELDQLYLHILRKAGHPAELPRILRAIMYFGDKASAGNLDTIFRCTGGVRFLLRDLRSIVTFTRLSTVQFFHASMSDFLMDPARSREFHIGLAQFQGDLACEYTRLIMLFSLTESGDPLTMAMTGLADCLNGTRGYPGLLSATLKRLPTIVDQGLRSSLPCLRYSGLECLLRALEMGASGIPEFRLRRQLETIRRRIESQLTELSDNISTLVRVLGICLTTPLSVSKRPLSLVEIGQLIGVPNVREIIQQTLGLPLTSAGDLRGPKGTPIRHIHRSLSRWLHSHHWPWGTARSFCGTTARSLGDFITFCGTVTHLLGALITLNGIFALATVCGFITPVLEFFEFVNLLVALSFVVVWNVQDPSPITAMAWYTVMRRSPQMAVDKYTWAWAWDMTAFPLDWDTPDVVHHLDLIYCCLRILILGIDQPLNRIPLGEKGLQFASLQIDECFGSHSLSIDRFNGYLLNCRTSVVLQLVLDRIDFTSISRALPTLNTEFYPRLFYLPCVLHKRRSVPLFNKNPSLRQCFQNIYSHLVQDPIISRAVANMDVMFEELPAKEIELLLQIGLAPGELFHLPAMQALFGVGVLLGDGEDLEFPPLLRQFLRSGLVKLQHNVPNNYDINDDTYDAHEHLAIACTEYILLRTDHIEQDGRAKTARSYAMQHWTSHLRCAKHSERLFKVLRDVVVRRDDVGPVIEWLERGTNTPEDVLLHWHTTRVDIKRLSEIRVRVGPLRT